MRTDLTTDLTVSPEQSLLIHAAGGRCALPVRPGIPVAWNRVVSVARWHRLAPLLWAYLRDPLHGVDVPEAVLAEVREDARKGAARSLVLQFELNRVLTLLAEEGIPAMLLKGAALVDSEVYPDPAMREMSDLDLLVPREQLPEAHALVADRLGYEVHGARLARDDAARVARYHHHYPLVRGGGSVIVELHQRLFNDRPDESADGLWARARRAEGSPARVLPSPEDLALHVAVHFGTDRVKQCDSALGQLADLVRIAERWPIDWDVVVERARAARLSDRLFLALYSAEALFGGVASPQMVRSIQPSSFTPALGAAVVRRRVLAEGPMLPIDQVQVWGFRRVFPGRGALERYVRFDEPTPSVARLRARRWVALTRRLATQLPRPLELARDVRLSRWMTTLLGE